MRMTKTIVTCVCLAVVGAGTGCDKGQGTGLLAISLTGSDNLAPESASRLEFTFSNAPSRAYTRQRFPAPGNKPLAVELPGLPAGRQVLDLRALDTGNCLVAKATKTVDIVAGKRIDATVVVERVDGACSDAGSPTVDGAASAGTPEVGSADDVAVVPDALPDVHRDDTGLRADGADTRGSGGAGGSGVGSGGAGGQGGGAATGGTVGTATGGTVGAGGAATGGQSTGDASSGGAAGSAGQDGPSDAAGPDTPPASVTLQVSMQGTGTGSITGPGVDCGKTCTGSYPEGTKVTLVANPDSMSVFLGWIGGNCGDIVRCEVTMTKTMTVVAQFGGPETLTIARTGAGTGSVVADSGDIACGDKCSGQYKLGTDVNLTAAPGDTGSAFAGWTGACTGIGNCRVTMSQARQVTAVFTWKFTQVGAGYQHTCAVRAGGQVVCWGAGSKPGDSAGQAIPPAGSFSSVSAGGSHTCGIRTDGSVACWGSNQFQQATPIAGTFQSLSAGWDFTCGIQASGSVACWGSNGYNQATPPPGTFTAISAGTYHGCGIQSSGTLACWGASDAVVNLGQATPPAGQFTSVSAAVYHTCAVASGVATPVTCWGNNLDNQASPPTGSFQSVSVNNQISCGLRSNGSVACWGNIAGLPDLQSPPAGPFSQLSTGSLHACALRASGGLVCFGNNDVGQTDLPAK